MICLLTRPAWPVDDDGTDPAVLLARELRALGDDVVVLTGRRGWRSRDRSDRGLVRPVGWATGGHALRSVTYGMAAWLWLVRHRRQVTVAHLHGGDLGVVIAGLAAQRLGIPTLYKVTRLGEDDPATVSTRHLRGWREEVIGRSLVVAVTPAIRDACLAAGVPATSIVEVPDGVDMTRFRPPTPLERRARRGALRVGADTLVACALGSVDSGTDLDALLRSWALVPDPALLLVIAPPPTDPSAPLPDRVRFVGAHPRPEEVLHGADVFVHLSTEPQPPVELLEAAACGLPAVVHQLPGSTDHVVASGVTGILVDGSQPSAVAAALRRLRDPSERQRLGAAARADVEARFSSEAVARRYRLAYHLVDRLPVGHMAAARGRAPARPRTESPTAPTSPAPKAPAHTRHAAH